MFYIAICDDNQAVCSEIEEILFQYKKKTKKSLEIEVFYDGESFLKYQEQGNIFDLVYLDIEMERGNGLWVSHRLRKGCCNYAIEIVYISGKEGYDRQLFAYQPLHFLAKPFTEKQIIEVLELALLRSEKNRRFFEYKKRQDIYRIPIMDILYFESRLREIRIVTDTKCDVFYASLDEIEEELIEKEFIRIHRSYLINYNRISVLRFTEVVMSNQEVLPISKSKRGAFRNYQMKNYRNDSKQDS